MVLLPTHLFTVAGPLDKAAVEMVAKGHWKLLSVVASPLFFAVTLQEPLSLVMRACSMGASQTH